MAKRGRKAKNVSSRGKSSRDKRGTAGEKRRKERRNKQCDQEPNSDAELDACRELI